MAKGKREGKTTQKEMVRTALDDRGWTTPPVELQSFIKERFHVELPTNIISNYKSVIKKELGEAGAGGPKPGGRAGAGMKLADLEAVQGLVTRLGADQVRKLVEMAELFE